MQLWHRRLGHLGFDNLKLMSREGLVEGLEVSPKNFDNIFREYCVLGKQSRQPFNRVGYRASKPLELVNTDVCGPITPFIGWI